MNIALCKRDQFRHDWQYEIRIRLEKLVVSLSAAAGAGRSGVVVSVAGGAGESCAVSVGDAVGAGAAGVLAAGRGGVCGWFFCAGLWFLAAALLGGAGVVFSDGRHCLCEPVLSVAEPGDTGGLAGNRSDAGVSGTDVAGLFSCKTFLMTHVRM